ncbi:SpaH/EbpB family LPXTG-anchored major pilin [Gemmiger sp.]
MKALKKAMSVLVSLLMIFTFALPAFADSATASITINNAVQGETYKAYKLLDLESYDASNDLYVYKVTTDWKDFFQNGEGKNYITVDSQDYAAWKNTASKDDANLKALIDAALAYAEDKNITPTATQTAANTSVKFDNLGLGYYLVNSSVGTLCELKTVDQTLTIVDKNKKPDVDKNIVEGANRVTNNDVQIGDTVNYEVIVHAKKGAKNYVLHDTMSKGLTFNKTSVAIEGLTAGTDYTLVTDGLLDGCTFEIQFSDNYLKSLTGDTDIKVIYTATLNENAVVKTDANTNKIVLKYGDQSTVEKETKTYTYRLTVVKKNADETKMLKGAIFKLSTDEAGNHPLKFTEKSGQYVVDPNGAIETITTTDSGTFTIVGLDAKEYYLTETVAPAGYNKLADPIKLVVSKDNVKKGNEILPNDTLTVKNQSGTLLPGTGGIGTTIFYVIGGLLMAAAAVLLITKKRMNSDK